MKDQPNIPTGGFRGLMIAFLSAVVFALPSERASADIPDSPSSQLQGIYKVASSNDPIFPIVTRQEWFLDFGRGISGGKYSGNVAVSLRENPSVKVRIMAWQYFPKQGKLLIGNPYSEGSNKAVAKGVWQLRPTTGGILFERGSYQVLMHRADPQDY